MIFPEIVLIAALKFLVAPAYPQYIASETHIPARLEYYRQTRGAPIKKVHFNIL